MIMFGGFFLCLNSPTIMAARMIAVAMTERYSPIDASENAVVAVDLAFGSVVLTGVEFGFGVGVGVDAGAVVGVEASVGVGVV
jgi:hypothetical protein